MPTEKDAITALKKVVDPEIHLDIYTLGLIYKIEVKGKDIKRDQSKGGNLPFTEWMVKDIGKRFIIEYIDEDGHIYIGGWIMHPSWLKHI